MLTKLKQLPRQSILTLIGTILIKLSTSSISCWGNINLYILSYFYHHSQPQNQHNTITITNNTNSILILVNIIPISFIMLFATKLCDKYGYQNIIKICSIVYLLAPFIMWKWFNLYTLLIFGMLLPTTAFSISTIPVINCLWTRFKYMKNKATAIAVVCFTIGGIFWNYMFTLSVNPNNQSTIVISKQMNFSVFSQEVSNNVVSCLRIGYLLCGGLFVIGAQLVSRDQDYEQSTKSQEMLQMGNIQFQNTNINTNANGSLNQQSKFITTTNTNITSKKQKMPLKKALLDHRFLSIFFIGLLTGVYQIFLVMNLKIIYMPIIKDDRFLVYCSMASSAVSIIGAFIWGYFADKRNFYQILFIFTILDCLIKIYGKFATTKISLMMLFIFIGLVDKAIVTVMGPGLVKIFGIDTATQLLPYKGLSMFFGFLIAPLGYIALHKFVTPLNYMFLMVGFSVISVLLALKLYRNNRYQIST